MYHSSMASVINKQEAHRVVDEMAEDATWEDLAYLAYLHAKLERGRRERDSGREIPNDEVFRRLGIRD